MVKIKDAENTILMELKNGTVTIELLPDIAPGHCERMKELVRSGQYDNVSFHRVIDGFMAQTGDIKFGKTDSKDLINKLNADDKAEVKKILGIQ